jgi:hypothetical protein
MSPLGLDPKTVRHYVAVGTASGYSSVWRSPTSRSATSGWRSGRAEDVRGAIPGAVRGPARRHSAVAATGRPSEQDPQAARAHGGPDPLSDAASVRGLGAAVWPTLPASGILGIKRALNAPSRAYGTTASGAKSSRRSTTRAPMRRTGVAKTMDAVATVARSAGRGSISRSTAAGVTGCPDHALRHPTEERTERRARSARRRRQGALFRAASVRRPCPLGAGRSAARPLLTNLTRLARPRRRCVVATATKATSGPGAPDGPRR